MRVKLLPLLFLGSILMVLPETIFAQGVTTASLNGVVKDADGNPLPGANVIAEHIPSGVSLGRAYCDAQNVCVGNGIYFDAVQKGQWMGKNFGTDNEIKDEAYLRIDKNRTKFTGYYSENGTDWMMIGEHEISMINPKVGIFAGQSYVVGQVALFDYFTMMEMP